MPSLGLEYELPDRAFPLFKRITLAAIAVDGLRILTILLLLASCFDIGINNTNARMLEHLDGGVYSLAMVTSLLSFLVMLNLLCLLTRNCLRMGTQPKVVPPMILVLGYLIPVINIVVPVIAIRKLYFALENKAADLLREYRGIDQSDDAKGLAERNLKESKKPPILPWTICIVALQLMVNYFILGKLTESEIPPIVQNTLILLNASLSLTVRFMIIKILQACSEIEAAVLTLTDAPLKPDTSTLK